VSTAGSVVNIDPYEKRSLFQLLTVGDREWVLDGGYSLIVTIGPADRPSTGLLLLGRKSSDAPFSREDQLFAIGLAATAALAVENATARSLVKSAPAEAEHDLRDEPAAECRLCGIVQSSGAATCARCRGQLSAAALPLVVLGKFKLECVLGRGGMGIVYRARDLALDRAVAIKTLPRLSADAARRMRREARTMALVTHPHLAVIHGAESWRGTPLLIVELLEGGTLSDRLLRERLTIDEALDLGMTISAALARVHDGGVLHRDIKPSNIGYMHDGTAKVLDFGLARLIESGAPQARPDLSARGAAQTDQFATSSASGLGPWRPAGTPAYMSPEAISGRRPEPSFDLWSLAVVLFEAIAGENPFRARSIARTFALIEDLTPDRLCNRLGPVPDPVVAFFKRTLAHSVVERPSSARHFGEEVRRCREALKLPHSVV
jgi:serine/threonine protein kinase